MRRTVLIALALAALTAACKGSDGKTQAGKSPSPPPPPRCPLTSVIAPEGFEKDLPPLVVKVENAKGSRPQAGLGQADVVYEELVEGGITRFMAVFHCSEAAKIGPVRSARLVDADILAEYTPALFAYSGGAPPVERKIRNAKGVVDLWYGTNAGAYYKEKGRRAPSNVFTSSAALRAVGKASEVRGEPSSGFVFDESIEQAPETLPSPRSPNPGDSPQPPAELPKGRAVAFSFTGGSPTRYTYDFSAGNYLRFHGSVPHKSTGGGQFSAVNVIILKVVVRSGQIKDAAGNTSPEISVVGSGDAIVLRRGLSVSGSWSRSRITSKTSLKDSAGKDIRLFPGNIWIELLPTSRPVEVT